MDEAEYIKQLGNNILNTRKKKGISQVEFANSIDLEDSSLRRIEKGRVNSTILMLRKIALGLNVTISELLPIENQQDGYKK